MCGPRAGVFGSLVGCDIASRRKEEKLMCKANQAPRDHHHTITGMGWTGAVKESSDVAAALRMVTKPTKDNNKPPRIE